MELIERRAAMDCCFKPQVRQNAEIFNALKMAIRSEISALQSVDAAPVVHGRWELVDEAEPRRYGCSKCSCLSWYGMYNYCPNCGAKMDLEGLDAEKET